MGYETKYMTKAGHLRKGQKTESNKQLTKEVKGLKKAVKLSRAEKDYIFWSIGVTSFAGASSIICLSAIAQGVNNGQRVGLEVEPISVQLRLALFINALNTGGDIVRVFMFKDIQNPPGTWDTTVANLFSTDAVTSHRNPTEPKRFKMLYDKCFSLSSGLGPNPKMVIVTRKVKGQIRYVGTGNIAASAGEGQVYLGLMSQSGAANSSTFTYSAKFNYTG